MENNVRKEQGMKVIQVIPSLSFAGAEVMCKNLSCELKRNGIDVSVICLYDTQTALSEQMEEAGIKIHYLGKKGGFDRSVYRKSTPHISRALRCKRVRPHFV